MVQKLCHSCNGPLNEFDKKRLKHPDFCPYCVDKKGELKSYGDILKGMIQYIEHDHHEIPKKKQLTTAQKWLSEAKVWQDKFVNKDVVVEIVRPQNIKNIPTVNKEKHYNCSICMFFMRNNQKERTATNKKEWFAKMQRKYKLSGGMILYYQGQAVGYAQFAPKKEFIKLEDYEKGSTNTDAWYISCVAIQTGYWGKNLDYLLLNEVIKYLKANKVTVVQSSAKRSKTSPAESSNGEWIIYQKVGFKKTSEDKDYINCEIKLN